MKRREWICAGCCAALIALDRISKAWAVHALMGKEIALLPGVLSLCYVENTGAAFGMFSGMRLLNVLLTFVLLVGLAVFLHRNRENRAFLATGTPVLAGGLSHLYDRLMGKGIVDFIRLDFIRFPVFNVADICICVGAVLLAAAYLIHDNERRSKQA